MNQASRLDEWLKLEFQQNFEHLRDRDERIIGLVKFYITLVGTVGTACTAVLGLAATGLASYEVRLELVGWLLVGVAFVGLMVPVWITAFRRYFVTTARQLNAIRNFMTSRPPREDRDHMTDLVVQPTDPTKPEYWLPRSAQLAGLAMVFLVNILLSALGAVAIRSGSGAHPLYLLLYVPLLSILPNGLAVWYVVWRLKHEPDLDD